MIPTQFEYLGRWVDTKHFCAFVYNKEGEKLAKSYEEFIDLVGSGLWFASKEEITKQKAPAITVKPVSANNSREATKNAFKAAVNLRK